jgi:hypothetical protein
MNDRITHTTEEWAQLEAEQLKAEDEAFARRKAQEGVLSPAFTKLVFRSEYGIHPDEQVLVQGRIDRINQHFQEVKASWQRAKQLAFEIGAELIDLKENKVYSGKWTHFCKAKFPEIHQRVLENCMQLARNREWLERKYPENETDSFFEVCPTIKLMLGDIQERNREERKAQGKPPIRHKSASKKKRGSRESVRDVPSEVMPPSHTSQSAEPNLDSKRDGEAESPVVEQSDGEAPQPACDVLTETVLPYPDETSEHSEKVEGQATPDGDMSPDGDVERSPANEFLQTVRRYNGGSSLSPIPETKIEIRYSLLHLLCPECRDTILATFKEAV